MIMGNGHNLSKSELESKIVSRIISIVGRGLEKQGVIVNHHNEMTDRAILEAVYDVLYTTSDVDLRKVLKGLIFQVAKRVPIED